MMKKIAILVSVMLALCLFTFFTGCTQAGTSTATPAVPSTPHTDTKPEPVPEPVKYTSNETLVAFVDSAAAYVKAEGAERALSEFNNRNGSFMQGELYIYAYGFNGTTLAHPVNPESIGKQREGSIGVFVTEMGAVVRNGSGFYRFTYINPQHNDTLESKMGYGVKIDDKWWLGSGVYTGPVDR